MFQTIKKTLYFAFAWYFRIFASIKLKRWSPRIIVITGSSGKTTLLHLVESQIGNIAKYSHHANSSIGIPFDVLDLHRTKLTFDEWPGLVLSAPFKAFSKVPEEKLYIVECDCDRPYEGDFLSSFLKPEVTLWTNVSRTHSMNFDSLVESGRFAKLEKAIAYEYGFLIQRTKNLVIINADNPFELEQMDRTHAKVEKVFMSKSLKNYNINLGKTEFIFDDFTVKLKYLMPKEVATSILMTKVLLNYLGVKFDVNFSSFDLPPGRNSLFAGVKGTTIVDSTYNANLDSMTAILNMFSEIRSDNKWAILGDMLEQGKNEPDEHVKLASQIAKLNLKRVILLGPRVSKYTYPEFKKSNGKTIIERYDNPKEVLDYIVKNLKGGEVLLFKGARFLEGVIEHLLKDKSEKVKLSRREKIWEARRKNWGL